MPVTETCDDNIDNDGDGIVDEDLLHRFPHMISVISAVTNSYICHPLYC